jgi:hypothetical protein
MLGDAGWLALEDLVALVGHYFNKLSGSIKLYATLVVDPYNANFIARSAQAERRRRRANSFNSIVCSIIGGISLEHCLLTVVEYGLQNQRVHFPDRFNALTIALEIVDNNAKVRGGDVLENIAAQTRPTENEKWAFPIPWVNSLHYFNDTLIACRSILSSFLSTFKFHAMIESEFVEVWIGSLQLQADLDGINNKVLLIILIAHEILVLRLSEIRTVENPDTLNGLGLLREEKGKQVVVGTGCRSYKSPVDAANMLVVLPILSLACTGAIRRRACGTALVVFAGLRSHIAKGTVLGSHCEASLLLTLH